jgi:hypothetical protein
MPSVDTRDCDGGGVYHAHARSKGARICRLAVRSQIRYRAAGMGIANIQNMTRSIPQSPQPYGVRVRLKNGDPFAKLLGADWQTTHWYFTVADRDLALEQMSRRHEFSRIGDEPALVFEKVENLAQSRWL